MSGLQLGVDIGGTFTDLVLDDGDRVAVAKVPSTPSDPALGLAAGMSRLSMDPSAVTRFVHGTTVATNVVLEGRGARTALVTTEGFRDLLEIGRQNRPKLYDLFADRTPPVVPRELVVEARERVAADGAVLRPLETAEAIAGAVARLEPEAVAVCLLFSFVRPEHERALGDALAGLGVAVSLSSEVLPVLREYERASTTCLNAYVSPALGGYLTALEATLHAAGLRCDLEVMRSGGGTFGARLAATLPVHTLLSGPAAGAWGAAAVGAGAGHPDLIAFDMGGTSTDATLIEAGRPRTTSEGTIAGLPFAVTSIEIHTVGAGGGSVAWRDSGGALRVGPRSAGADPGPACYGRGGTEPTVTDAYLCLGLLDPTTPLGGVLEVHTEPAARAVESLGGSLGLDLLDCAAGILRVTEAQIAKALRVVSVERGRDPREFALLAFGGAGPLHQGPLARELGCPLVIVPRYPGVLSALGLLAAPASVDLVCTRLHELGSTASAGLEAAWRGLEEEAERTLARQGLAPDVVARSADCRYRGQAFELEVPVPPGVPVEDAGFAGALAGIFHAAHRERYGYAHDSEVVELVNLRVRADAPRPRFSLPLVPEGAGADAARRAVRSVVLHGRSVDCPVYAREALGAGDRLAGPALVAGVDSTCLLLAGQAAEVDGFGNLLIREG